MDLNLGWPTGPMRLIRDTQEAGDYNDEGVYVRFFDYGAVILNIDDRPQTVTNSDLISMPGYNGPYYRFQGGQNPGFNDGSMFNQVSLNGIWDEDCLVGDGIILTKNPTVMVSDIYIDNDNEDTSPGQPTASLIGNWLDNAGNDGECRYVKKAWTQGCRDWPSVGVQQLALAYTTDNSARAVYTPTINIPGQYEVFEWHGDRTDATEATNVRHLIRDAAPVSMAGNCTAVAGGADCIVNQRDPDKQGQWNSLGIYTFNSGYVEISAQGADGTVIADAIKFVYQGNYGNIKVRSASQSAAVVLTKSSQPATAARGENIVYTINYRNHSDTNATQVMIKDPIPQGTTYLSGSASGNGQYSQADKSLSWALGSLSPGSNGSLSFTVRVE